MPHVEEREILIDEVMDAGMGRLGHRVSILGTSHKTNRGLLTRVIAHTLVDLYPDKYHEVADKKGVPCPQPK